MTSRDDLGFFSIISLRRLYRSWQSAGVTLDRMGRRLRVTDGEAEQQPKQEYDMHIILLLFSGVRIPRAAHGRRRSRSVETYLAYGDRQGCEGPRGIGSHGQHARHL